MNYDEALRGRNGANQGGSKVPGITPQQLIRDGQVPVIGKMKDLYTPGNVADGEFKIAEFRDAGFSGAERNLLQNGGWTYLDGGWYPPQ